jgi:hypothetical protein
MKRILQLVSLLGLLLTVGPAVLVFGGVLTWTEHANAMLIGALLWFATAPFWMKTHGDRSTS